MKKRRRKPAPNALWACIQVFLLLLLALALGAPVILILAAAPQLGVAFVPVLMLYVAVLAAIPLFQHRRRERLDLHALMGDEAYYAMYPKEKRRRERREAARKRRAARRAQDDN